MSGHSSEEVLLIEILNFITGLLSVVACIWLFKICSSNPRPWPVSLKLILVLTSADFIYSFCNFVAAFDANIPALCAAEAIVREWSLVASLYWACCISLLTYKSFVHGSKFDQEGFFTKSVLSGAIISLILAVTPMFFKNRFSYGSRLFGCWVTTVGEYHHDKTVQLELVMIFMGIPAILSLLITLVTYSKIASKVDELTRSLMIPNDLHNIGIRKLFWYPAVIFLSCIPALIDNIIQIYFDFSLVSFNVVHVILFHSLGFSNALVYGLQRRRYNQTARSSSIIYGSSERTSVERKITEKIDLDCSDFAEDAALRNHRNSCDELLFRASTAGPL